MRQGMAVLAVAAMAAVLGVASASAADNPWLSERFLNMAHQGGEREAPSNTLYAFKSAVAERGADSIELDVNLSSDGRLMVIHNSTVDATTDHTGPVDSYTAEQLNQMDAAHWYIPGQGQYNGHPADGDYAFRGVRYEDGPEPPQGYSRSDFGVPTLDQVFAAFPDTPINVEIKVQDNSIPKSLEVAQALAEFMQQPAHAGRDDVIVVSFAKEPLAEFVDLTDGQVAVAPSEDDLAPWALNKLDPDSNPPVELPGPTVAFQVPPTYDLGGVTLPVPQMLLGDPIDVHSLGYAVHVFTEDDEENDESYQALYDAGVDGIMTMYPARLHAFLCSHDVYRPDGSKRCPSQPDPPSPPGPPDPPGPPGPPVPPPPLGASLSVPRQSVKSALAKGIRAKVSCDRECSFRLDAWLGSPQARRIGFKGPVAKPVVLGRATASGLTSARTVRIKVKGKARKGLKKMRGTIKLRVDGVATPAEGSPVNLRDTAKLKGKKKKAKKAGRGARA